MSTQQATQFAPYLVAPSLTKRRLASYGLSFGGVILFLSSLLVVGTGFKAMRPDVGGLALHPYLVLVVVACPFVVLSRLGEFPIRILVALAVFCGMFFFSVVNGTNISFSQIVKVSSGGITLITCALLVRRRGDFVAGALGLSIAVAILAVRGLKDETLGPGLVAIEDANKNSYSLFALPALLMAGYIVLKMKKLNPVIKALLVGLSLPSLVIIFMGANRSGWLGAVVVALMLFWDSRGKGLLFVAVMAAGVAFYITQFGSTVILNERVKQTVEGNSSDRYRRDILIACVQVALENPIIGISPQQLSWELGRRTSVMYHDNIVDPHNVYGFIMGASGLICFAAMFAVGFTMFFWKPRDGVIGPKGDPVREARNLMRMMVILWAVRGFFTHEILYAPAFNIGLGLCIGFCVANEVARNQDSARERKRLAAV